MFKGTIGLLGIDRPELLVDACFARGALREELKIFVPEEENRLNRLCSEAAELFKHSDRTLK